MIYIVPNKQFGSLLEISPPSHIVLKTFNSEFQKIKVWFTDQNSNPLEVEYKINLTDSAKKSATDALKITGIKAIQKTAKASADLVGNFIADKITSI